MNVFVHAWFRSGSTWLWEKFRTQENFIAYYEPLQEDLPNWTPERIRAGHVVAFPEANHPDLDRSYYYEYLQLVESGRLAYKPSLAYERYFLSEHETDPILENYIFGLLEHAQHQNRCAALCFCRSAMRSQWLKSKFRGIHIAQIRNPLSQWTSFQKNRYFLNRTLITALSLEKKCPGVMSPIDAFNDLHTGWIKGDRIRFTDEQCLQTFLCIWIYSAAQSVAASDIIIDIDLVGSSVGALQLVCEKLDKFNLSVNIDDCAAPDYDRSNAHSGKFETQLQKVIGRISENDRCRPLIAGLQTAGTKYEYLHDTSANILRSLESQTGNFGR